jgi:putative phosphoesterase
MPIEDFLPGGVSRSDVIASLALVSDTHMPNRCRALPPALFDALAGADLLLHAGDVGELWVLDKLSAIAPVVAVHGNDETPDAKAALPYELVTVIGGERIFLWHSHYPDWEQERASRQGDDLLPKLEPTIARARAAGARLAVFGHWHIPLVHDAGDLLVVNPGAIASGNEVSRQLHQTVALAWLLRGTPAWRIVHVEVGGQARPWDAHVEWQDGFAAVGARYQASIFDPSLSTQMPAILAQTPPPLLEQMRILVHGLAHRVWAGELPLLTLDALVDEALAAKLLDEQEAARLRALVEEEPAP